LLLVLGLATVTWLVPLWLMTVVTTMAGAARGTGRTDMAEALAGGIELALVALHLCWPFWLVGLFSWLRPLSQLRRQFGPVRQLADRATDAGLRGWGGRLLVDGLLPLLEAAILLVILVGSPLKAARQVSLVLHGDTAQSLASLADLLSRGVWRLALVLLGWACIDYFWQRWRRLRALRMTRAEVAREQREQRGDPRQAGERRRRQREMVWTRGAGCAKSHR
jgi:flagellar biosynthesis protein FlhB